MRFRILIGLLFGLIVLYVAYWFVLANRAEKELNAVIDAERLAGAAIAYDELEVRGFPYRLEFAASNLDISREEANGVAWRLQSPELVVVVQPWKLTHAIAFARTIDLTLSEGGGAPTRISGTELRASAVMDTSFDPERLAAELKTLTAVGPDLGNAPLSVTGPAFHWRKPDSVSNGKPNGGIDSARISDAAHPDDDAGPLQPMQSEWAVRGKGLTHPALGESPYGDVIETFDLRGARQSWDRVEPRGAGDMARRGRHDRSSSPRAQMGRIEPATERQRDT